MRIIDPHVHVWINDPAFPWPAENTNPPTEDRSAEDLLALMDAHGVEKTVLVQVRDAADRPTEEIHRSHSQDLMLHGINPLECRAAAEGTLDDEETANADKVSRHVPSKV